MNTIEIIITIIVAIILIIAVIFFINGLKDDEKEQARYKRIHNLYHEDPWEHTFNLEHKGVRVFNLPFTPIIHEVFYLESHYDKEANEFVQQNLDYIKKVLATKGLTFVYLPEVKVTTDEARAMVNYMSPDGDVMIVNNGEELHLNSDFLLNYMVFPRNRNNIKSSFAWYDGYSHLGYFDKTIYTFHYVSFDGSEAVAHPKEILAEMLPELCRHRDISGALYCKYEIEPGTDADSNFEKEEALSDKDKQALEEIRKRLDKVRKRGISEAIIAKYVKPYPKLSRMTITHDFRIILNDYKNMEITMEPLVKTVYILFLRHPEGIMFKDLPDYRKELEIIYRCVKEKNNRIDQQLSLSASPKISKNIEALTDPTNNSINEKCARIKAAFVSKFYEGIAKNYFIDGTRLSPKTVVLPRNLIIWEDVDNEQR